MSRYLVSIFLLVLPLSLVAPVSGPSFSSLPHEAQGITVVFDLGGVLVDTDSFAALRTLGIVDLMRYKLQTGLGFSALKKSLQEKLYDVLYKIQPTGNDHKSCDAQGVKLPGIMCDWMSSRQTNKEILASAVLGIKAHPEWFISKAEQQLILNIITMTFDARNFIATRKLFSDGCAFVRSCKKQGCRIVILSNWDKESFALLKKQNKLFFDLFDAEFISGNMGIMKPAPHLYARVKAYAACDTCIFIDDQSENITAAQKAGMQTIRCKATQGFFGSSPNFTDVQHEFAKLTA